MLEFKVVSGNLVEVYDEDEEIGQIVWTWFIQAYRFSSGREFCLSTEDMEQVVVKMKELEKARA